MGYVVWVQLLGVHELVDPREGDVDLDQVDQKAGQEVQGDPEHVEVGQGHEGCLSVEDVVFGDEDEDCEGREGHQYWGAGPKERGECIQ